MKNRQLIELIETGKATAGQYRRYADLVSRRKDADPCTHGHMGCALVEGGPCLNESLGNAETMDIPQRAAAELERRGEVAQAIEAAFPVEVTEEGGQIVVKPRDPSRPETFSERHPREAK